MAWFRTLRRQIKGNFGDPRAWKRFDGLGTTATDRIAYHGDSRAFDLIQTAGGLKRYISAPATPKPRIMDSGGTANTVTTTKYPDVAASYACRGGGVHTTKNKNRFIYAIFIPQGRGIDLTQLAPGTGPLQMSDNNRRTAEILVLDIPLANVLGYVEISSTAQKGSAIVLTQFTQVNALPAAESVPQDEKQLFLSFQQAATFNIIAV